MSHHSLVILITAALLSGPPSLSSEGGLVSLPVARASRLDKRPTGWSQTSISRPVYAGPSESDLVPVLPIEDLSQAPQANDLWVDAASGNDLNDGRARATAFRTIQKAANMAAAGTTVHILPGVYRETVQPAQSGSATQPIRYVAENGPGTAIIRGSEPASSLTWTPLTSNSIGLPPGVNPANIYSAALSAPPRFVARLNSAGNVLARLPLAREPDEKITTEWKYHEYWWAANGGKYEETGCNPPANPKNCDASSRSSTQLTDTANDTVPSGIELGNLKTVGNLTGGMLVAIDNRYGHYMYRRAITGHDTAAGRITVSPPANAEGIFLLGWGTKYYVEGKPYLLDTPGEWWYDQNTKRLYLWPPASGSPAAQNIEISRRSVGFSLSGCNNWIGCSYITLDGLALEFFNENAIEISNGGNQKSYGDTVRHARIRYASRGVVIDQGTGYSASNVTDGFTLENSEVAYIDNRAIHLNYWSEYGGLPASFTHAGIVNTVIRNNELHHLSFRSDTDNATGALFMYADKLRFEGNHVHHIAQNGMQFSYSVIQSSKEYGFTPQEIKTGEILIKDNIFEQACQNAFDCGALKFWGNPPDTHVFRDVLITGNVFRNNFGWTYIGEKRGYWSGGPGSAVQGMGGFGLYMNVVSGMHVYRNIAYNNGQAGFMLYGNWRDGGMVYYNNIAANSLYGFYMAGLDDVRNGVSTLVANNMVVNNEAYGILLDDPNDLLPSMTGLTFDHDLYYGNGWSTSGSFWKPGAMTIWEPADNSYYPTLANIRTHTVWEDHGAEGDPHFQSYTLADRNMFDGSWPDLRLTGSSTRAIDRGTSSLPASLATLLAHFGVDDARQGTAFDIGRYERGGAGWAIVVTPASQMVSPSGVARYALSLSPSDWSDTVYLTFTNPSPMLIMQLTPNAISLSEQAILTITDTHPAGSPLSPGLWYTVPITGAGGGLQVIASAGILIGGTRIYLPILLCQ